MLRIALSHMHHRGAEKLQLRAVSLQKDEMIAVYKVFNTEQMHRVISANGGGKRMIDGALQKIEKGGILFTFSCSQAVDKEQFRLAVFTAAAISGRHVRILHQLHQPADHPINIYHPEGEYLKGLVLYVE